ncbi:flagellar hook-basal body complex protein FliE [Stakelama sp. CBK3Z-3]|uniref:Flagellar hook-basal body complex protein FliE n=1 Tax=Stakelama flava TaxID=2860338 RepID=A0ABS6XJQ2_9SPHN|nr:flagellar hook-basal body complex protein FliE [Stakelama flava]MBW4330417.1 flagellar hook-basal body complex protein FliE [Stakelama flava]
MSIGALDAAGAYGRAAGLAPVTTRPGGVADTGASGEAGGFGQMVQSMVEQTAGNLHAAETASSKQVAGKGDLIDVVTAMGAAEMALDTVVAVRDKVVGAYSEIMRMQI